MRSASFGEVGQPGILRPIDAGVPSGWLEEPANSSGSAKRSNDHQVGVPRDGRGLGQRSCTPAVSRGRGHLPMVDLDMPLPLSGAKSIQVAQLVAQKFT